MLLFITEKGSFSVLTKKTSFQIFLAIVLVLIAAILLPTTAYAANVPEYDTNERVFLSDIPYVQDMSYVQNGYNFHFDEDASSRPLSLQYNGEAKEFQKGVSAWATSNLVYDLSGYSYDKFTAYVGVSANQTSDYFNDGAVITIYTSDDGENWTVAHKTKTKKGVTDADYVEIPIKGVKYLRLYAYNNGANWWCSWYDDVLYADAKLVKNGFVESNNTNDLIHPVEWYDKYLTTHDVSDENFDLYLLQRELVKNVGYNALQFYLKYNGKTIGAGLEWLLSDKEALEYYLIGGAPDGTYKRSFEVLTDLLSKYKDDMAVQTVTKNGVVLGDLYKRMIITLSLTHSAPVGTWITGAPSDPNHPNGSNAVNRYFIYKKLHNLGLLEDQIFEKLTVEEMRMVMNNIISDEEIEWLNYYSRTKGAAGMNPYTYIDYSFDYNYLEEQYYDPELKEYWTELYNLDGKRWGEDWNLTFTPTYGYTKLWIVFEENSVCGGIAKTGVSLQVARGIPSSVVGQPGHAAYIHMSLNAKGEKEWVLGNDVSGWAQSGRTEKLHIRLPLGWGSGAASNGYVVSYFPLIQAGFDDYDNYEQAEKYLMLADVYKNDFAKAEECYRNALKAEEFNFDAWVGLIDLYAAYGKDELAFRDLATEFVPVFTYYPLPMDNLLTYIGQHIKSEGGAFYLFTLRTTALNKAKNATKEDVRQPNIAISVAKYLAGEIESGIVEFTFDGYVATPTGLEARKDENGHLYAGYILLAEKFKGSEIFWQYMINGRDWKDATGIAHKLTEDELAMINAETDVKVRIVGALDVVYTVDITKGELPRIYGNDLENTIFGIDSSAIEYFNVTTGQWENAIFGLYFDMETYEMREPIFEGDQTIYFRRAATRTETASDILEVNFTQDDVDPAHSYIKRQHLKVIEGTSFADDGTYDQAINGDIGNFWITKTAQSDPNRRYITISLDEPVYLSALQYVPRQSGVSGIVTNAQIQVRTIDGKWKTVVLSTNWEENAEAKYVEFEKPILADAVKVIGIQTSDGYMSAALINLFEDTTAKTPPTATVTYDITTLTNKDVTAVLHPDKYVEIYDPAVTKQLDGTFTHVFEGNGSYIFTFKDAFGNEGTAVANVDWIDKDPPEAAVEYSTTDSTSGSVIATLKSNDPSDSIIITNNNGNDTYIFDSNGSFVFTYRDLAGNEAETEAKVDWIRSEAPNISLEYDILNPTNKPVTVEVICETEFEIVDGDNQKSHVFYENGEWTFNYKTENGYSGSLTARVTWIDKEAPIVSIVYSTDELTNQPVTATLLSNETIIIDTDDVEIDEQGRYFHTFTENGSFLFEYRDLAGNTGSETATVTYIDTTPPEASVTYSKTTLTNETVVATLTSDEPITIINNNGSSVRVFDKNGSFEFIYTDAAGNVGRTMALVDWIDKQPPVGKVQYSPTEATAGPVVATIVCDDEPIFVTNNDGKPYYTFEENGRFEFIYRDEAGNVGSTYAEVTWIIEQDVRIEYNTTDPTNGDVVATIVAYEGEITVTNNGGDHSYTFKDNGKFTFEYTDQHNNKGTITAEVTWIDRQAPAFEVQYDCEPGVPTNRSVTVTLLSDEDIIIVSDINSTVYSRVFTYVFDQNDVLTLIYHDRAGNSGTYQVVVDWIDKDPPVGSIIYSREEPGKAPVKATLIASEDIIIDNNGGSNEFTFNYNGTFEFLYHDNAGNTGSTVAEVTWITAKADRPPVITIDKSEFIFDMCTDPEVDLSYFTEMITITDDKDDIDINDPDKVTIESDLKWEVGDYTITVTVKDSGHNTAVLTIKIKILDTVIDFASLGFEVADGRFVYNGSPYLPSVTVKDGTKTLIPEIDYTVVYTNNVNAGDATILLSGLGRYRGIKILQFTIEKATPVPAEYPQGAIEVSYDVERAGNVPLPAGWTWKYPERILAVGDNELETVYIVDDNYEILTIKIIVTRLEEVIPNQPPVITVERTEFLFDRRISIGMDILAYLKDFIIIDDDRDGRIDPYNADLVSISFNSRFDWNIGRHFVTVTATDSDGASSSEVITVEIIDSTIYIDNLTIELESKEFIYNGRPHLPAVTVKYGDEVLISGQHYRVDYDNNIDVGEATVTVTGLGIYSGSRILTFTIIMPAEEHEHDFSGEWKFSEIGHWHECPDDSVTDEILAHTESDWIVDEETTTEQDGLRHKECTVCGYVLVTEIIEKLPPDHEHDFSEEWISDETGHWHECPDDSVKDEILPHIESDWIIDVETTVLQEGIRHKECIVCGYILETETIDRLPPVQGDFNTGANIGENAPNVEMVNPQDILTDEDIVNLKDGAKVTIVVTVENADETVSEEDRQKVKQTADGCYVSIGQYLDIMISKTTETADGFSDMEQITETNRPVRLVITVPGHLLAGNRLYAVLRVHNGEVTLLSDLDDVLETVTIETDRFSAYTIVYWDQNYPDAPIPPTIPSEHQHIFDWFKSDDTYHWRNCITCMMMSDFGNHAFFNGICYVCGYIDPNYVPETDDEKEIVNEDGEEDVIEVEMPVEGVAAEFVEETADNGMSASTTAVTTAIMVLLIAVTLAAATMYREL